MSPSKDRPKKGTTSRSAAKGPKASRPSRPGKAKSAAKPAAKPAAKRAAASSSAKPKRSVKPSRAVAKPQDLAPAKAAKRSEPLAPLRPVEITATGARVIDVLNVRRETVGRAELTGPLFTSEVNPALLHEAVVMQLASRRQGTADTKERGEVSGSGRKPWKQKGTGRARAGSVRSPIWRGGGTVFGPTPRGYGFSFPRKKGRGALASAMSAKVMQNDVIVLNELALTDGKTREMAGLLRTLGLDGRVLVVHRDESGQIRRASGNLGRVTVVDVGGLNVYDVLLNHHILLMQSDLPRLSEAWT